MGININASNENRLLKTPNTNQPPAPKKVMLGVIDLNDPEIETPQKIAERIRAGLKYLSPDKLLPAPDCGMSATMKPSVSRLTKILSSGA